MQRQMHAQPVVCYGAFVTVVFLSLAPTIEPFLRKVVSVYVSVDNSNQVCSSCNKFLKRMLASDVTRLSAAQGRVRQLKAK